MKKNTLILMLTLVLFSCSKDDDTANSNISIHPPSWIQGTWLNEDSDSELKFTSNDMFFDDISYVNSYKMDVISTISTLYDKSSNTEYSIHMKTDAADMEMFQFTKVSSTEIGMSAGVIVNGEEYLTIFKKQ